MCSGGERNLTECDYSTINNCDRYEEAGVRCEGIMHAIDITLFKTLQTLTIMTYVEIDTSIVCVQLTISHY